MARKTHRNHKVFQLETRYLGEHTDLKKVQERVKRYKFLNRDHPLVMQIVEDEFAVLTKFGTITFWNVKPHIAAEIIAEVLPSVDHQRTAYEYHDTLAVHVGDKIERATFEELYVKELDVEKIKIISYVSAQSVALDRYEEDIDARLRELGKVVQNLKGTGQTRFSQRNLLRQVGNVLHVKQSVVSALALFDKPNATWEREEIEKLYDRLRSEYELVDRLDILNEKIDFLSENNTTLLDFVTAQRNNFLELIIVILVVIEILLLVGQMLKILP